MRGEVGGGGGWRLERRGVGELIVLFWFFGFYLVFTLECQLCQELSLFVPFQKDGSILKTLKQ